MLYQTCIPEMHNSINICYFNFNLPLVVYYYYEILLGTYSTLIR